MRVHAILAALTLSAMPIMAQAHGPITAAGANANSFSGSSSQSLSQGGTSYSAGGDAQAGVTYAPTSVDNSQYNNRNAYAPDEAVVTANACALGTAASAGGGGFFSLGLSLANTDKRCGHEADAAAWHAMGNNAMATAMMCLTPDDAHAYMMTFGVPCPGQPGAPASPLPPGTPVAAAVAAPAPVSSPPPVPAARGENTYTAPIPPVADTTEALNDASLASIQGAH